MWCISICHHQSLLVAVFALRGHCSASHSANSSPNHSSRSCRPGRSHESGRSHRLCGGTRHGGSVSRHRHNILISISRLQSCAYATAQCSKPNYRSISDPPSPHSVDAHPPCCDALDDESLTAACLGAVYLQMDERSYVIGAHFQLAGFDNTVAGLASICLVTRRVRSEATSTRSSAPVLPQLPLFSTSSTSSRHTGCGAPIRSSSGTSWAVLRLFLRIGSCSTIVRGTRRLSTLEMDSCSSPMRRQTTPTNSLKGSWLRTRCFCRVATSPSWPIWPGAT